MKEQNICMTTRKMIVALVLLVLGGNMWGQNRGDTIYVKEPTYVYSHWIEDAEDSSAGPFGNYGIPIFWDLCDSSETAMRFYTDIPLQIKGAAGLVYVQYDTSFVDTNRFNKSVDYFHLYEIDSNDQLVRLNSARLPLDMAPARWMEVGLRSSPRCTYYGLTPTDTNVYRQCFPIIECFFDKPSFVQDSFYLGLTNRSLTERRLHHIHDGERYWRYLHPWLFVGHVRFPSWIRCEGELVSQLYRKLNNDCQWEYWQTNDMMLIWPIFDTNGLHVFNPLDTMECAQVDGLRVMSQMDDCYLLMWNGGERQYKWELAYGPEGSTPEACTVVECSSPQKFLCGLDTAQRSVIYVRGYCGRYKWGEWSEGLVVGSTQGPGDPEDPVGIEPTLVDRFVTLAPNPGSEWMQVLSSFGMRRVRVTDATGRMILDERRSGAVTQVDVSGWASGTYYVQVETAAGTTTKKFVKR